MMTYLIHSLSACYFPDNTPPGQGTHLPPHTPPGSTDEECVCSAEPSSPGIHTTGGTGQNSKCYFPFIYSGVTYYGCADKDTEYAWCATSTYLGGQYYNYKYCDADDLEYDSSSSSGSSSGTGSGSGSSSGSGSGSGSSDDDDVVYTISGEECSFPFKYEGVTYYGCTTQDYGERLIS